MIRLRRLYFLTIKCPWQYSLFESKRPLYSSSVLGIDSFIIQRKRVLDSMKNVNKFKQQLIEISKRKNEGMVFVEDLRKMIGIAQSKEDLKLLFTLLRKYSTQKNLLMFKGYNFGPEIMRLLHVMNEPDEAIELVEDIDMFQHFQHLTSIILLLDMLFENQRYQDVVRMYEYYQSKIQFHTVPTRIITIFYAACYKLNTAESFEMAIKTHKMCLESSAKIYLRNCLLLSALALKQNEPSCVFEVLTAVRFNSLAENLKCMAFAQAKRFEDVFTLIRAVMGNPYARDFFITNEALSFIEKQIEEETEQYRLDFQKLKEELVKKNVIVDQPLDKYLCSEIHYEKKNPLKTKLEVTV